MTTPLDSFVASPPPRAASLPADGFYPGVDSDTYHRWDAASNSRLSDLDRSPAYCRERIDHPTVPTPALVDGAATHTVILEPALFDVRYVVAPTCVARTAKDEECGNGASLVIGGKGYCKVKGHAPAGPLDSRQVISAAVKAGIDGRLASIAKHARAAKLMASLGVSEASFIWTDAETGVPCKGRLDRLVEVAGRSVLVDVKRTRDAHPDDFSRFVMSSGVHRQLAFYRDGLRAVGKKVDDVLVLAVMDDAPYEVYLYRPLDIVIDQGRAAYRAALADYAECSRKNEWPMGTGRVLSIDLPEWAKQKIAAQTFMEDFNRG